MPVLRSLNDRGIEAFREFLRRIRAGAEFQESPALLYADDTSRPLARAIRIEPQTFASKFAAATYLAGILAPLDSPGLAGDAGLWSWLALFYFDQLSPLGADGRRRPRDDYHYIPPATGSSGSDSTRSSNWTRDRHLLAGPYKLYRMHGRNARLLLHPPVHQHGRFVYDLGWRHDLITNRGLVEAIDTLYWNPKTNRPKRGATMASRPGTLRRFITVAQQLDFNYDLYGMTASEILALLPSEFDAWRSVK
jgi:hypothetical protein